MQVVRLTPDQFDEALSLLRAADAAVYGDSDWTDSELREWFRRFRESGETVVALGVDAENPTGAVRLYDHAGMRVLWRADVWEKELRGV